MTTIETIRAEIERLIDEYTDIAIDSHYGTVNANHIVADLEQLLSFLDTLESEKPMNQDELEKAVVDYFEGYWPGMETPEQCNTDLHFTPLAIMRLARHFAQWGAEHLKK